MKEPLTPNNIDLRNFEFMPLDVVRLRDSDFAALVNAEAFRAGILLMCASWHQVPAGSLPDDDRILSNLAGFGRVVKEWKKYKEEALHGWILCSDGRYYHPVICEKAMESWNSKQDYNYKKFAERLRKANMKLVEQDQILIPNFETWIDAGMPDSWVKNSQAIELESKVTSKAVPNTFQSNSEVVPQEFQARSAGIPLENGHKGTEHNGQGQGTDILKEKECAHTKNHSSGTNTENLNLSVGTGVENLQLSSGIPSGKSLDDDLNLWKPSLDQINLWRQRAGLLITTEQEFNQTMITFLPHYAPQIRSGRLLENQIYSKYIAWVKRDNSNDKPKAGLKPKLEKPTTTGLNVNDAWKDQPMNDQPFYGTVELPEGME